MKRWQAYWKTEEKRALRVLPAVFGEAVVITVFFAVFLFVCGQLFGKSILQKASVGIVRETEDGAADMALSYLEGMETVKAVCTFSELSLKEGRAALNEGKLAALVVLPNEVVESVLDGSNLPVQIYIPKENSFGTLFLTQLAEAGGSMLSKAQAEIYAIHDLTEGTEFEERLPEWERDINLYNLRFAVNRERMIEKQELEITGELPLLEHYLSAGVILLLFLTGTACGRFLKEDNRTLSGQLYRSGIGTAAQITGKLFAACTVIGIIALPFAWRIPLGQSPATFLSSIFCVGAVLVLCYEAVPERSAGVICIVAGTVLAMFLSGGLISEVFLPEIFHKIAALLPMKAMIQGKCLLPFLYGLLCYAGATLLHGRKGRGI